MKREGKTHVGKSREGLHTVPETRASSSPGHCRKRNPNGCASTAKFESDDPQFRRAMNGHPHCFEFTTSQNGSDQSEPLRL
jgi:hypothetical protein